MAYKLVCVHPYFDHRHKMHFERGQEVTDPAIVDALQEDREHHFVRVAMPSNGKTEPPPAE